MPPKQIILLVCFSILFGNVHAQNDVQTWMKQLFTNNFPEAQESVIKRVDHANKKVYNLSPSSIPIDKIIRSSQPRLVLHQVTLRVFGYEKTLSDNVEPLRSIEVENFAIGEVMAKELANNSTGELYELELKCQERSTGKENRSVYTMIFLLQIEGTMEKEIARGIQGKLLLGKTERVPLVQEPIMLKSGEETVASTTTNQMGEFNLDHVFLLGKTYTLFIPNPEIAKNGQVYLANDSGSELEAFEEIEIGFKYKLLPRIVTRLRLINNGDAQKTEATLTDKLSNFINSSNSEMDVVQEINYQSGAWNVPADASTQLSELASALIEHPEISLQIISHTDSRGDNNDNLNLSMKRANAVEDYLVDRGIREHQLSSKGLGESRIINRCIDGVKCSQDEHAVNRRTEFHFSKSSVGQK